MRLFISINLPENINAYVKQVSKQLDPAYFRIVKQPHITLKFLGDVEEKNVSKVKELLHGIQVQQFTLTTSKLGFFPNSKRSRVLWLGFEDDKKLKELNDILESNLKSLGFKKDDFKAHITIARIKTYNEDSIEKSKQLKVERQSLNVRSFYLMRSTLTKEGHVHEVLENYILD